LERRAPKLRRWAADMKAVCSLVISPMDPRLSGVTRCTVIAQLGSRDSGCKREIARRGLEPWRSYGVAMVKSS
jgi:hypothetical protein